MSVTIEYVGSGAINPVMPDTYMHMELLVQDGRATLWVTPEHFRSLFGVFEDGKRIDDQHDVTAMLGDLKSADEPKPSPIWTGRRR